MAQNSGEPKGALLPADAGRAETTGEGTGTVQASQRGDRARSGAGLGGRIDARKFMAARAVLAASGPLRVRVGRGNATARRTTGTKAAPQWSPGGRGDSGSAAAVWQPYPPCGRQPRRMDVGLARVP